MKDRGRIETRFSNCGLFSLADTAVTCLQVVITSFIHSFPHKSWFAWTIIIKHNNKKYMNAFALSIGMHTITITMLNMIIVFSAVKHFFVIIENSLPIKSNAKTTAWTLQFQITAYMSFAYHLKCVRQFSYVCVCLCVCLIVAT